jgi:steroid delta-isomerase-like uncharacterized protein
MNNARRTLAHDWFEEVWNKGRGEAIAEMLAEDGIAHGLTDAEGNELRGPAAFRTFFEDFKSAFPDLHVEVVDTICEGDKIVARCEVRGTHTGEGIGMLATHRPVVFTGTAIIRVENNMIVEAWNNFDFQAMYTQLGQQ